MRFLDQLHTFISNLEKGQFENLILILPNIRAKIFLSDLISSKSSGAAWLPQMYSSKEFMEQVSGLKSADDYLLMALLFKAYSKSQETSTDFNQFLNWAPSLLQDFKEVDQQLADAEKLFSDISELKSLELWSPDGELLSEYQKKYLSFCKNLSTIYANFKLEMDEQRMAHVGYIERVANDRISNYRINKDSSFVVAGFNALSQAEIKLFNHLRENYKTNFIWDYDKYYVENINHEAGHFARINQQANGSNNFNWIQNHFSEVVKDLKIYSCVNSMEQAVLLPEILNSIDLKSEDQIKTTIVLPDEKMLIPVLQFLPDKIDNVNVTMGYSLINSPFYGLFDAIFKMYLNLEIRLSHNPVDFYYKDVLRLLNEYGLKKILDDESISKSTKLKSEIIQSKIIYVPITRINELFENTKLGGFKTQIETHQLVELIYGFIQGIDNRLKGEIGMMAKMERAFLKHHADVLKSVSEVLEEVETESDMRTILKMWKHYSQITKIQFSGEPVSGLQIMGLLETRNLDFENVIVLNVNEGILPSSRSYGSIIPNEVKSKHNLLIHKEKESVFAYHFYRMLQRASNIHLIYSTHTEDLGGGEMSRFIMQLKKELPTCNPKHSIREFAVQSKVGKTQHLHRTIRKSPEMIQKLIGKETGFSPSALSKYLECPLNFYYRYVIGLRDIELPEENIEAKKLGTIIHAVLKDLYDPYVGKRIDNSILKSIETKCEQSLVSAFEKEFGNKHFLQGKNKLTFHLGLKFLKRFVELEFNRIKNHSIELISLEKKYEHKLNIVHNGQALDLTISGIIDRLEICDGNLQIIDYKSGSVKSNDLVIKEVENVFTGKKDKAFQLFTYAWIISGNPIVKFNHLKAQIFSFKAYKKGFLSLEVGAEEETISAESLLSFETQLKNLVEEILNSDLAFEHKSTGQYCDFC